MYHFIAPFRISFSLSQCLPLSTFPYSAFLLFRHTTCLFSAFDHIIHPISAIFKIFLPLLTTIPDEGLSQKRRIIKVFFKFTYFALGSLISKIIVSLYVTSATQNTSTVFLTRVYYNMCFPGVQSLKFH